jgi:hypothetical protein
MIFQPRVPLSLFVSWQDSFCHTICKAWFPSQMRHRNNLQYSDRKCTGLVTQINILLPYQITIPTRAVAHLLEAMRCDPKVAGSVPHRVIGLIFNSHYGPVLDLGFNRIEYKGKGGRCVRLTTLPHSCADYLEILGASTCWTLKGLSRSVEGQPARGILLTTVNNPLRHEEL